MKKLFLILFFIFPVLGYLIFLIQFELNVTRGEINLKNPPNYYDYKGITNVHSSLSTGSMDPKDIIRTAVELNYDFIFISEVNAFPQPRYLEGYHDDVLVLVGGEYSFLDSRLMHYDTDVLQTPKSRGQAQVYFSDKLSEQPNLDDGFVILAHPFLKKHPWKGEIPGGFAGIEVINLKRVLEKAWEDSKILSIGSLLIYPFNSPLALIRLYSQPEKELELWDRQNKKGKTVGILAADATAKAVISKSWSLEFPSYKTSLAIGSNHLLLDSELTGNFESDRKKILKATFDGQFYMALDIIANPKGFYAEMISDLDRYPIGAELDHKEDTDLIVQLPNSLEAPFEVLIYKDGKHIHTSNSKQTNFPVPSPGVYRVEVRVIPIFPLPGGKRWLPWIYTNAFYVK